MRIVRRKWGWYWTIIARKYFKVKLLWFKGGHQCSHQSHAHRNELWLTLFGNGVLLHENYTFSLVKGKYHKIATNDRHQFKAHTRTLILEIQYGFECREDDIIRYAGGLP